VYSLAEFGWSDFFQNQLGDETDLVAARVAEENRELYRVFCEPGEFLAELSGKLRHRTASRTGLPAVGDWVLAQLRLGENRATIHRVLGRKGKFSRKVAGRQTEEQIVAANVDVVFLVSSLNREFNARRIERYLALAWDSGARPVIVLNKSDLCENAQAFRAEAEDAAMGAPVMLTSAASGAGLVDLRALLRNGAEAAHVESAAQQAAAESSAHELDCAHPAQLPAAVTTTNLQRGLTAALLGSSGVGKSSLINALIGGEQLATQAVREGDDRGRHTTTTRQMILVPGGGVLIDTPGMRELQLWDAADGIGRTFGDIQELAASCKFRDCKHQDEPGCAVRAAVAAEALDAERVESFHKLEREERFLESKQDAAVRSQRTKELRKMMKSVNRYYRERGR